MIKNKKQLLAFTVVEMLIWLLITSCMLVLTFKVIRHNENNKIPTYIYYFYKNIQDASATIIDTLRQKEENHGKIPKDILNNIDIQSYCKLFANSVNTLGKYDCEKASFLTYDLNSMQDLTSNIDKNESVKTVNNTHLAFIKFIDKTSAQSSIFIFASFGKPFNKGTFNKDIYQFEHLNNKIIPSGFLSSNENSPLKFDVITRDYMEAPIRNINSSPIIFCEAMKYAGGEFTKFSNCLDESNNLVTKYNSVHSDCKTNIVGCNLRPAKPSNKF